MADPLNRDQALPPLPVPPLSETITQYLEAAAVLQTPNEHAQTVSVAQEFLSDTGPRCQRKLEKHAREQERHSKSWLTDFWLTTYLDVRAPLQLATNVAFQITWPEEPTGIARAADFIYRISSVHLQYLRGELPPDFDARGSQLTAKQWRFLAGGARRPHPNSDRYEDGPPDAGATTRHVVVLHREHAYVLAVSDQTGAPIARADLEEALEVLTAATPPDPGSFTALTRLPSDIAADLLERRLESAPHNHEVYSAVRDALFVVDLALDKASDADQLRDLAFGSTGVYAHKPTSYRVSLSSPFIGVNIEHSILDGATLLSLITRAKAVTTFAGVAQPHLPKPLEWRADPEVSLEVADQLAAFQDEAQTLNVSLLTVPAASAPGVRRECA